MSKPVVGRVEFGPRMRSMQVSADRIRVLEEQGDRLAMRLAERIYPGCGGAQCRRAQRALASWRQVRGQDA